MNAKRLVTLVVVVGVIVLIVGAYLARATIRETHFSDQPMEAYLAEQIALDPHFGAMSLPPQAASSSRSWVAVVDLVGTEPQAPEGCDIYLRYFAGVPGPVPDAGAPVTAQAGFAVAHVRDPDEPSGPVTFRFPRDGSLWAADMQRLMPERYWRDAKPNSFDDLEAAWRLKARAE